MSFDYATVHTCIMFMVFASMEALESLIVHLPFLVSICNDRIVFYIAPNVYIVLCLHRQQENYDQFVGYDIGDSRFIAGSLNIYGCFG